MGDAKRPDFLLEAQMTPDQVAKATRRTNEFRSYQTLGCSDGMKQAGERNEPHCRTCWQFVPFGASESDRWQPRWQRCLGRHTGRLAFQPDFI